MDSFSSVGKKVRLSRILRRGRAVAFAFDHGVEHGPGDFPPQSIDPNGLLEEVISAGVDAVMMLPGMARLTHDVWAGRTGLIVKLTSKSNMRPDDGKLLQSTFGYVDDAVALSADAVAATVYWGSPYEDAMLERWFAIRSMADSYGLPCMQLAYPRGPTIKDRYSLEIVRYGARAASESGADIIKTYYTGSRETFRDVVKAAGGVPVMMSGGPRRAALLDFLHDVRSVLDAGGSGVVVGRNVFQHPSPGKAMRAVLAVVHENAEPEEAEELAGR